MVKSIVLSKNDIFTDMDALKSWTSSQEASGNLGHSAAGHRALALLCEVNGMHEKATKEWHLALGFYLKAISPLIKKPMNELTKRQVRSVIHHSRRITEAENALMESEWLFAKYDRINLLTSQLAILRKNQNV